MPDKPVAHGYDHRPGGLDPIVPGYWHYVHSSTSGLPSAWSNATNYIPGDTVTHDVFIYSCMLANTNVEPNVNSFWANYWIISQPIFQNSWKNVGGSFTALRYRIAVGQPHITDLNDGSLTTYSDHQLEIQGSINGGSNSTIIFYLPPAYTPQYELRLAASDDVGGFAVMQVKTDGSVWKGIG